MQLGLVHKKVIIWTVRYCGPVPFYIMRAIEGGIIYPVKAVSNSCQNCNEEE